MTEDLSRDFMQEGAKNERNRILKSIDKVAKKLAKDYWNYKSGFKAGQKQLLDKFKKMIDEWIKEAESNAIVMLLRMDTSTK